MKNPKDRMEFQYNALDIIKEIKKDYGISKIYNIDFLKNRLRDRIKENIDYMLYSCLFDDMFKE